MTQMIATIYHFTDTVRLPWIAAAGELRPGWTQAPDHPCAFLWATASPHGDPSAAAFCDNGYREDYLAGHLALVRITLHAEDFELWSTVPQRYPQWTPEHVHKLEYRTGKALGDKVIRDWRVRSEPLPLSRVIRVETKRYLKDWRTINVKRACVSKVVEGKLVRGVVMHGDVFASRQDVTPERIYYDVERMSAKQWAAWQ